jgi:hypothetical protein
METPPDPKTYVLGTLRYWNGRCYYIPRCYQQEYFELCMLLKVIVNGDDILHIVSKWTGVPLNRMEQKEAQKLLKMEEELKQQVIGQDEAVIAISKALRRSRADLKDPRRPIGSIHLSGSNRRRKNFSGTFLGRVHVW